MTTFDETAAAAEFVLSAESRETDPALMAAIAYHANTLEEAEAFWNGDLGLTQATHNDTLLAIAETATNNHRVDAADLQWGGQTLADALAEIS